MSGSTQENSFVVGKRRKSTHHHGKFVLSISFLCEEPHSKKVVDFQKTKLLFFTLARINIMAEETFWMVGKNCGRCLVSSIVSEKLVHSKELVKVPYLRDKLLYYLYLKRSQLLICLLFSPYIVPYPICKRKYRSISRSNLIKGKDPQ